MSIVPIRAWNQFGVNHGLETRSGAASQLFFLYTLDVNWCLPSTTTIGTVPRQGDATDGFNCHWTRTYSYLSDVIGREKKKKSFVDFAYLL